MSPKAPPATSRAKPRPPAREAKRPAKGAVKIRKQGAKRKPKLTVKQAKELAARRAARRKVLLVVGDYGVGLAMLAGAVWWLVWFLSKR
jgi:hypothetical protein